MQLVEDIRVFLVGETSFHYLDEEDKKNGWMLFENDYEQCIRILPMDDVTLRVDVVINGVVQKGDGVIDAGGVEITSLQEFEDEFFLNHFSDCYTGRML